MKLIKIVLKLIVLSFFILNCNINSNNTKKTFIIPSNQQIYSASEFLSMYIKDIDKNEKLFMDSTIFIIGKVEDISDSSFILLSDSIPEYNIVCIYYDRAMTTHIKWLEHIKLRGICKGLSVSKSYIEIDSCVIAD